MRILNSSFPIWEELRSQALSIIPRAKNEPSSFSVLLGGKELSLRLIELVRGKSPYYNMSWGSLTPREGFAYQVGYFVEQVLENILIESGKAYSVSIAEYLGDGDYEYYYQYIPSENGIYKIEPANSDDIEFYVVISGEQYGYGDSEGEAMDSLFSVPQEIKNGILSIGY